MRKEKGVQPALLRGFTLVEMLVVMAILAVLIGIAVAGIGFALRRSRNTARQAAAANLDKAFQSYYSDEQMYPRDDGSTSYGTFRQMVEDSDLNILYQYLEGSWDAPPISTFGYNCPEGIRYTICVSQEESQGQYGWRCYGPAIDYDSSFPHAEYEPDEALGCDACGNLWGCVNSDGVLVDGHCPEHDSIVSDPGVDPIIDPIDDPAFE